MEKSLDKAERLVEALAQKAKNLIELTQVDFFATINPIQLPLPTPKILPFDPPSNSYTTTLFPSISSAHHNQLL